MRVRKLIAALFLPFLGSIIGTNRRDLRECYKQEKTLEPQAVSHEISHYLQMVFASFDTFLLSHLKYFWRSSKRKTGPQKGIDGSSGQPSGFQAEKSPCLPKFNLTPRIQSSPPTPSPATSGKHKGKHHKSTSTKFCFPNFHFNDLWGTNLWPDMLVLLIIFFKKEDRNKKPDF